MQQFTKPVIYDYLDVAKYLRDYYDARHSVDKWFSYRYIQNKTGIDPGFLFKIFLGKRTLPQKKISDIVKVFDLSEREREYLILLVLYGKARSNEDIRKYFEKILQFREIPVRKLMADEYEYYTKWYYAAIRQLLSIYTFRGNYNELARLTVPAISSADAKKAVTLLCKIGLVEKMEDDTYRSVEKYLSTGKDWHSIAIRNFQKETIHLADQALDTVQKDVRDISTVTVTLSKAGFEEARERIRRFRQEMLELVNMNEKPDSVYHINIQMIPIGHLPGKDPEA